MTQAWNFHWNQKQKRLFSDWVTKSAGVSLELPVANRRRNESQETGKGKRLLIQFA